MKKRALLIVVAIMLAASVLTGCTSKAEKAAAGDYKLSDVEFSVTMGAIGVNMTTETLKGSQIGYYLTDDFCGLSVSELKKIYNMYADATLTLKTNKKAELTYGSHTENFTWKIKRGSYVDVSGIALSAVSDSGTAADATAVSGYIAENGELWFTLTTNACTVKYVFEK